jgi:hypothetical protein
MSFMMSYTINPFVLSVIKLTVIMPSVTAPCIHSLTNVSAICLFQDKVFMLSVIILNAVMLSVIMPNAVMLNVIMLSVVAPCIQCFSDLFISCLISLVSSHGKTSVNRTKPWPSLQFLKWLYVFHSFLLL